MPQSNRPGGRCPAHLPRGRGAVLALLLCALLGAGLLALWMQSRRYYDKDEGYRYLVGVSQFSLELPSDINLKQDIQTYAPEIESINLLFMQAASNTERQNRQILTLLDYGVDAIIVSSQNPKKLEPSLAEVRERGIPLVVVGGEPGIVECDVLIYTDYQALGRRAGAYLIQTMGRTTCLEIHGVPRSRRALELQDGFRQGVGAAVSAIYVVTGYDSSPVTRQRIVDSGLLAADPPIDAIFAHSDHMAEAAVALMESRQRPCAVVAVGNPRGKRPGLELLAAGRIAAVVVVSSGGEESLSSAVALLEGRPVRPDQILPHDLVDAKNVDQYIANAG